MHEFLTSMLVTFGFLLWCAIFGYGLVSLADLMIRDVVRDELHEQEERRRRSEAKSCARKPDPSA